jgi:hypothetical protein
VLLDWSGYTGGGSTVADAESETYDGHDANASMIDVVDEPTQPSTDAMGTSPEAMATDDAMVTALVDSSTPPRCSPESCGGCCTTTKDFCAYGAATTTCGIGGEPCQSCAEGLACVNGACVTPPPPAQDSGPVQPPECVPSQCGMFRCIPYWEMACCRPDKTCGCLIAIAPPPYNPCM